MWSQTNKLSNTPRCSQRRTCVFRPPTLTSAEEANFAVLYPNFPCLCHGLCCISWTTSSQQNAAQALNVKKRLILTSVRFKTMSCHNLCGNYISGEFRGYFSSICREIMKPSGFLLVLYCNSCDSNFSFRFSFSGAPCLTLFHTCLLRHCGRFEHVKQGFVQS